jgi:hypothetical protein
VDSSISWQWALMRLRLRTRLDARIWCFEWLWWGIEFVNQLSKTKDLAAGRHGKKTHGEDELGQKGQANGRDGIEPLPRAYTQ